MPAADVTPTRLTPGAEKVLATASRLFYDHGIHAVGVDRVAAEAGVTKKTLYDRFGSKQRLVLAYLGRREQQWRDLLAEHLARHPDPGPSRVLAVFDAALERYPGRSDKGCAAVNARAEEDLDPTDRPVVDEVTAQKTWLRRRFVDLCVEAGYADADLLGRRLHLLLEGALVTLATRAFDAPLEVARSTAELLLQTATVGAR